MDLASYATAQAQQTARHQMDVSVLTKLKSQQELEGQAAVRLIETAGSVQGAAEPGKGAHVDVVA